MDAALRHVAKKEGFDLPDEAAAQIINDANGNLRKALLVLEALKMQSYVCALSARVMCSILINDLCLLLGPILPPT